MDLKPPNYPWIVEDCLSSKISGGSTIPMPQEQSLPPPFSYYAFPIPPHLAVRRTIRQFM